METKHNLNRTDDKTIGEFMGLTIISDGISLFDTNYNALPNYREWNNLMPVLEMIESKKANIKIKTLWNEFNKVTYHQCTINIEVGEMSKDRSVIYNSKKIYEYIGDTTRNKLEAVYKGVMAFIKWYNQNNVTNK